MLVTGKTLNEFVDELNCPKNKESTIIPTVSLIDYSRNSGDYGC